MLMVIIVTDMGLVKETIIKADEDITEEQVETLNYFFNNKLKGQPLEKIDKPLEEYIFSELHFSINIIKSIIEQIKILLQEENYYLEDAKRALELP